MIRVTYEDKTREPDDDFKFITNVSDNHIELLTDENNAVLLMWQSVAKIEKQVKDLTLEETIKLNIYRCNQKKREVLVLKGYANDIPFGDTYKFDDYIDITNLVKEKKDD